MACSPVAKAPIYFWDANAISSRVRLPRDVSTSTTPNSNEAVPIPMSLAEQNRGYIVHFIRDRAAHGSRAPFSSSGPQNLRSIGGAWMRASGGDCNPREILRNNRAGTDTHYCPFPAVLTDRRGFLARPSRDARRL